MLKLLTNHRANMDYSKIFNTYKTSENIPFLLLNRSVAFPEDRTLDLYDSVFVSSDTPWTILSYKIYGTIEYWWILCSLNKSSIFYAPEGDTICYVKPEYIELVLNTIKQ